MFILQREYADLYGQALLLRLERHLNHVQISLRKNGHKSIGQSINPYLFFIIFTATIFIIFLLNFHGKINNWMLGLSLFGWIFYYIHMIYGTDEESLMVFGLVSGIQIIKKNSFGFIKARVFLASEQIIINEVITANRVIYLMQLMIKNQNEEVLIPLFLDLKPRLDCLKVIYSFLNEYNRLKKLDDRKWKNRLRSNAKL